MEANLNYWMAQLLIMVFYIMTLVVYSRARNEYVGGKIGNAINLILLFLRFPILMLTHPKSIRITAIWTTNPCALSNASILKRMIL